MKENSTTKTFDFHRLGRRKIVADFDGGTITSDAGALLLRELEQASAIIRQFSECFIDHRNPDLIEHPVFDLVAQRMYGLVLGYEELYCARGDMENRIKEQQLFLFADRTSTPFIWSNQVRLWFSSVGDTLLQYLREFGLKNTIMEKAQCNTIRLKLLKIGACVKISVRRVLISLSEAFPYQRVFRQVLKNLRRYAPAFA